MLELPEARQQLSALIADLRAQRNFAQADAVHSFVGVIRLKSAFNMRLMDLLQQREALVHDGKGHALLHFQLLADCESSPRPVKALAYAVEKFAALKDLWCYFTSTKGVRRWDTTSPMHVLHFLQWAAHWLDAHGYYLNVKLTYARVTDAHSQPQSTFSVCEHTITQFVAEAPARCHTNKRTHSHQSKPSRAIPYKLRMRLLAQAVKVWGIDTMVNWQPTAAIPVRHHVSPYHHYLQLGAHHDIATLATDVRRLSAIWLLDDTPPPWALNLGTAATCTPYCPAQLFPSLPPGGVDHQHPWHVCSYYHTVRTALLIHHFTWSNQAEHTVGHAVYPKPISCRPVACGTRHCDCTHRALCETMGPYAVAYTSTHCMPHATARCGLASRYNTCHRAGNWCSGQSGKESALCENRRSAHETGARQFWNPASE